MPTRTRATIHNQNVYIFSLLKVPSILSHYHNFQKFPTFPELGTGQMTLNSIYYVDD